MKKILTLIIATLWAASATTLRAQQQTPTESDAPQWRNYRKCLIDWKEPQAGENRYTVGLRPGYLINFGLKADFEFELHKGGRWLQFELAGRRSGWRHGYESWENFESGFYSFSKIDGFGFGAAYKQFLSSNGWYFSAGAMFNYYNVHHPGTIMVNFTEDGTSYQRYEKGMLNTRYYKPAVNINIGKHIAFTRHLFIDLYIGLGYARSFFDGAPNIFDHGNPFTMAYSGILCSGGFRIGWVWGCRQ